MKNYYCLVAGMPDIALDDSKLSFTTENFREEYMSQLTAGDRKLVELFFLQFDNRLLLALLEQKEELPAEKGCFSAQMLTEAIEAVHHDQTHEGLPEYMYRFIASYAQIKEEGNILPEDVLTASYYEYAGRCSNPFVREWFTFNQNMNNILIALTARKYGFQAAPYLIGEGELVSQLASSAARDFGIGTELDYIQDLIPISELSDSMEKERKMDVLKWNWLDEHTFFHYFSIERIFAFLIRLNLVERWMAIDKEKGGEVFRNMIQKLTDEVEVPAEYRIKK